MEAEEEITKRRKASRRHKAASLSARAHTQSTPVQTKRAKGSDARARLCATNVHPNARTQRRRQLGKCWERRSRLPWVRSFSLEVRKVAERPSQWRIPKALGKPLHSRLYARNYSSFNELRALNKAAQWARPTRRDILGLYKSDNRCFARASPCHTPLAK